MKRVRLRSVEDIEALPENEWVEVVGGMKFNWVEERIHVEGGTLVVPLPAAVRKRFKVAKGELLSAKVRNGKLVVSRKSRKKARGVA